MGLFSSASNTSIPFPWKHITSLEELETAWAASADKPAVFFKHSTRCSISSMALRGFQSDWNLGEMRFGLYYIDLIAHRDVSNALAEKAGVVHQSPQVIVVQSEKSIYNASHEQIQADKIVSLTV
jgi:bacillithiol system protein YtxJ